MVCSVFLLVACMLCPFVFFYSAQQLGTGRVACLVLREQCCAIVYCVGKVCNSSSSTPSATTPSCFKIHGFLQSLFRSVYHKYLISFCDCVREIVRCNLSHVFILSVLLVIAIPYGMSRPPRWSSIRVRTQDARLTLISFQ